MDYTEDLDLEDLESRLYSQIYHSSADPVDESEANIISYDFPGDNFRKIYRYFENPLLEYPSRLGEPQSYIPLTNTNSVTSPSASIQKETDNCSVQNTISVSPNSTVIYSGQNREVIQNNITVNQYSIPVVISADNFLPPNRGRYFPSWCKENDISSVKSIKKNKSRRRAKSLKKFRSAAKPVAQENTVTIYISDSDSDECVAVEEDMSSNKRTKGINTKFPKKYNEADGGRPPEIDDDVIFIPPPPIEVISVDIDEKSPKSVDKSKRTETNVGTFKPAEISELITTPEASFSNDFLETGNIEPNNTNFNFGLHGSDFNSGPIELRQPSKPTEYCETESSCSTNEHRRNFSNTVKTIVFDEVEFPREDIFSDKNLESFGSFITPSRSSVKPKESCSKTKQTRTVSDNIDISSDTSSSESDYEMNTNKKADNLPNLSPMVPYDILNSTSKKAADFWKEKNTTSVTQSVYNSCENLKKTATIERNAEKSTKKKKDFTKEREKSSRRKKRCLENENIEILPTTEDDVNDNCVITSTPKYSKPKRKKKRRDDLSSTSLIENTIEEISVMDETNDDFIEKYTNVAEKNATIPYIIDKATDDNNLLNSEKSKRKKKKRTTSTSKNLSDYNTEALEVPATVSLTENSLSKTHIEIPEQNIDSMETNVTTESALDLGNGYCSEKSKNKKKRRNISISKNLTDYNADELEIPNFTTKNNYLVVDEHIDSSEKNAQQFKTLDTTRDSEDGYSSEKSKKKKMKRGSISSDKSVDKLPEEKLDNNVDVPTDSLEAAIGKFIKDVEITTELSRNFAVQEKLKKKKKRENSSSERILEVCANDQLVESEISLEKNNIAADVIPDTLEQEVEIPTPEETNAVSQELLESENFDKSRKKRKKRESRWESIPEKLPENSCSENVSDIIEEESGLLNEHDNSVQIIRETENEQITVTPEIVPDTKLNESLVMPETIPEQVEIDSNTIVLDSDDSSDNCEIIPSSESETDFEVLDDVGNDLFLNCLLGNTTSNKTNETNIGQEYYETVVGKARAPLEGYEKLDLSTIQSGQSDDPEKWLVSFKDRTTSLNRGNRGPRCNRCRHFGHIGLRCPDKPDPPSCTLCGEPDHQEPRCPNKRCTQCGHRGDYSTTYCYRCFKFRHSMCRLCKMIGHIENSCPDLWRRYHLTTDQGPMIISQEQTNPRDQQWCSGCARRGHLEHECNYYNRQFPPTTPFIINYEDNLEHNKHIEFQKNVVIPTPVSPAVDLGIHTPNVSLIGGENVNTEVTSLPNLSTSAPVHNMPPSLNRIIIPSLTSPNLTIKVSNDPPNVSAIHPNNELIFQMKLNFDNNINAQYKYPTEKSNDVDLDDIKQIKNLIMSMPHHVVTNFLQKQMDYLHKSNIDPRLLKRKVFRFDRMVDSKKTLPKKLLQEKNFWYRTLNMFVFGVHKHKDGNLHVNYLKRYLSQAKSIRLDVHKRTSLFSSYSYIFGCTKHANVNYYKLIRLLTRKYYSNKSVLSTVV